MIGPETSLLILDAKSYKSFDCWRIDLVASANFSPPEVKNKPVACFLTNNCIENSFSNCEIAADIEGEEMNVFKNDNSILKNCSTAIIELHPKIFSQLGFSNNDFFKLAKEAGLYPRENCEDVFVFTRN